MDRRLEARRTVRKEAITATQTGGESQVYWGPIWEVESLDLGEKGVNYDHRFLA